MFSFVWNWQPVFQSWLSHFTVPSAMNESSCFFSFSSTFGVISDLDLAIAIANTYLCSLLRAGLVIKNTLFWVNFKMATFPLHQLKAERRSLSSLWEMAGLLKLKLTEVWSPLTLNPLGFFNLSNVCTLSLQQFISYSLGFPTPVLIPAEVSLHELLPQEAVILFLLFVSNLEAVVCLWPQFSNRSGRVVDF